MNTQDNNDERSTFEAWARSIGKTDRDLQREDWNGSGEYSWITEKSMWEAWQARAALSALPAQPEPQGTSLADQYREHFAWAHAGWEACKQECDRLGYMLASTPPQQAAETVIPKELDVRTILLAVVPSMEGDPVEVFAENVGDVEDALSKMGSELEDWQLGLIRRLEPQQAAEAVDAKDELTDEEAPTLEQVVDNFVDDEETSVEYETLMDFARRGFLHCKYFEVLPEAEVALNKWRERAALAAEKGAQS